MMLIVLNSRLLQIRARRQIQDARSLLPSNVESLHTKRNPDDELPSRF